MSVGYHVLCGKCRKSACVAVRRGVVTFSGNLHAVAHFIVEHSEHANVPLVHEDEIPDGFVEVVDSSGKIVTVVK